MLIKKLLQKLKLSNTKKEITHDAHTGNQLLLKEFSNAYSQKSVLNTSELTHDSTHQSYAQLRLDTISCWRGSKDEATIKEISLHVKPGEILTLMGASGSGKTSILRVIAGLEPRCQGRIYLEGQCIQGSREASIPTEKRGIGFVFQDYALFPHLTVENNIRFGLTHLTKIQQNTRIQSLLSMLNIQDLCTRYPHQLSGGQQQRVALARAVAPMPKILLLDEPFSHLDQDLRQQVRQELIHTLKQENMTMIWVTHDHKEALSIGDRIAILEKGRLIACDTAQNLYFNPPSPLIANWLGEWSWWTMVIDQDQVYTPFAIYTKQQWARMLPNLNIQADGVYTMGLRTQGWSLYSKQSSVHTIDQVIQIQSAERGVFSSNPLSSPLATRSNESSDSLLLLKSLPVTLDHVNFEGSMMQLTFHYCLDRHIRDAYTTLSHHLETCNNFSTPSVIKILHPVHHLNDTSKVFHGKEDALNYYGQVIIFNS
jgi:ABC-type Fe3+/spermidine/putrescine transport system ATPase subunit